MGGKQRQGAMPRHWSGKVVMGRPGNSWTQHCQRPMPRCFLRLKGGRGKIHSPRCRDERLDGDVHVPPSEPVPVLLASSSRPPPLLWPFGLACLFRVLAMCHFALSDGWLAMYVNAILGCRSTKVMHFCFLHLKTPVSRPPPVKSSIDARTPQTVNLQRLLWTLSAQKRPRSVSSCAS